MTLKKPYCTGAYNKWDANEQWIRITEGCPHNCPFCYEPQEFRIFGIPEIIRSAVKIMDMNLLCKPEALDIIRKLGSLKANGKGIKYELVCGIDYRFLTREIAEALKECKFERIRIAWDWGYGDQFRVKKAISKLIRAGYRSKDLMIFMICNWKVPFSECCKKLNLCKYWNVKVADCYYDGQVMPDVKPVFWSVDDIKTFRHEVRKHNQITNFGIDPELRKSNSVQTEIIEIMGGNTNEDSN